MLDDRVFRNGRLRYIILIEALRVVQDDKLHLRQLLLRILDAIFVCGRARIDLVEDLTVVLMSAAIVAVNYDVLTTANRRLNVVDSDAF